jgi:hypothetical protein
MLFLRYSKEVMKKIIISLSLLILFNTFWNTFLYIDPDKQTSFNYLFNVGYALIFLFGSIFAFMHLKKHPLSSFLGKSFFFYALSLLSYALGLFVWAYYNLIVKTEIPYPGISDLFFLFFSPFSALGFFFLVRSFGSNFTIPRLFELILLFTVIFAILYSFLAPSTLGLGLPLLAKVLNIIYPMQDAFLTSLVIIGLRTEKGVLHPSLLIFAFAALAMAVADTAFSYRTAIDIYWNGDFADTGYLIAASLFSIGLIITAQNDGKHLESSTTASIDTLK